MTKKIVPKYKRVNILLLKSSESTSLRCISLVVATVVIYTSFRKQNIPGPLAPPSWILKMVTPLGPSRRSISPISMDKTRNGDKTRK